MTVTPQDVFSLDRHLSPLHREAMRRTFESVNTSLPGQAEMWQAVATVRAGERIEATLPELRQALDLLPLEHWAIINGAAALLARGNAFDTESDPRLESVAERIAGYLPGYGRVLDVGCWKGSLCGMLLGRGYDVHGMDVCEMPEARAVLGDRFHQGWAHRLLDDRFWEGEYDMLTCLETLEHIPWRVLRSTCDAMVRVSRLGVLVEVPGWDDGAVMHLRVFTLDGLISLFPHCSPEVLVAPNSSEYTTVMFRKRRS